MGTAATAAARSAGRETGELPLGGTLFSSDRAHAIKHIVQEVSLFDTPSYIHQHPSFCFHPASDSPAGKCFSHKLAAKSPAGKKCDHTARQQGAAVGAATDAGVDAGPCPSHSVSARSLLPVLALAFFIQRQSWELQSRCGRGSSWPPVSRAWWVWLTIRILWPISLALSGFAEPIQTRCHLPCACRECGVTSG